MTTKSLSVSTPKLTADTRKYAVPFIHRAQTIREHAARFAREDEANKKRIEAQRVLDEVILPEPNDTERAQEMAEMYRERLLIRDKDDQPLQFKGGCWRQANENDLTNAAMVYCSELADRQRRVEFAQATLDGTLEDDAVVAGIMQRYNRLKNMNNVNNVKRGVRSKLQVEAELFNTNKWLISTPAGTWDHEAEGAWKLRENRASDFLTRQLAVSPCREGREPELYNAFVLEMLGTPERVEFFNLWMGYTLTRDISEQKMLWLYGPSGSGKSTVSFLIRYILGDLAGNIDKQYMFQMGSEPHSQGKLKLMDIICCLMDDMPTDKMTRDDVWKSYFTGGPVQASPKGGAEADFMTAAKFMFTSNGILGTLTHKANRRRLIALEVVDREAVPRNEDGLTSVEVILQQRYPDEHRPDLLHALQDEAPQILRLWLNHTAEWRQTKLVIPADVEEATQRVMDEIDYKARWVAETFEIGDPQDTIHRTLVFKSWKKFCEENGMRRAGTSGKLYEYLREQYGKESWWSESSVRIGQYAELGFTGLRWKEDTPWKGQRDLF